MKHTNALLGFIKSAHQPVGAGLAIDSTTAINLCTKPAPSTNNTRSRSVGSAESSCRLSVGSGDIDRGTCYGYPLFLGILILMGNWRIDRD
jgi:hypothetical protein